MRQNKLLLLVYPGLVWFHTKVATDAKSTAATIGSELYPEVTALATASVNVPRASAAVEEMTGTSEKGSEQLSTIDVRFRWNVENFISQMRLISLKE